jgi:hypothetical protein
MKLSYPIPVPVESKISDRLEPKSLVDRSFREAKRPGIPLPGDYATGFANVATTTDLNNSRVVPKWRLVPQALLAFAQ